jgi:uncharacterized protein YehS (DUF1456 family)
MTNNDILKKLRYIFDYGDDAMIKLFADGGMVVTRSEVSDWLKKEEDPAYKELKDVQFATFLNGFIIAHRGRKEGPQPAAEERLNNNIIFRKIKIALSLIDEDIIEILKLADFKISKHELSAFFRNPTAPQYRPCKDQIMRNFLMGLQIKNKG